MQGWGAMNPTALKEAAKVGFPMDHLVGVWWAGGEDDVRPAGADAKGYLALSVGEMAGNIRRFRISSNTLSTGKDNSLEDKVGEGFV